MVRIGMLRNFSQNVVNQMYKIESAMMLPDGRFFTR